MESNLTPETQYTQVTVDVPEDRVAAFHAFFARFLEGRGGRRRGRGHGRRGRGHHGGGCGRRSDRTQQPEPSSDVTEV
jgi:hypothetical protein